MDVYHTSPLKKIFSTFQSSEKGLSEHQVHLAKEKYGVNVLSIKEKTPLIIRFLMQFKNFFSLLLLSGALLSFVGHFFSPNDGNNIIGFALLGVTLLNAFFTFLQEFKAEQAMKSFKDLLPQQIPVLRNGKQVVIAASELVPGDIMVLSEGDKIPADARLIEQHLMKVDHSSLTGESEPQLRSLEATSEKELLSRNMVFSGTLVQSGSGKAIVVRTGDSTFIGGIAKLTDTVKLEKSKIKQELDEFVKLISGIAITLGVVFFGLSFVVGMTVWQAVVFAIGIIVANVPEGLLPTVTLTLSIAAQKMAKKNALVKDIESIETLGSITTICTDKTGTLTQNKLRVSSLYYDQTNYEFDPLHNTFYDPDNIKYLHVKDVHFGTFMDAIFLCNNSIVDKKGSNGDPTEIALKEISLTQRHEQQFSASKRLFELPFDSERKFMVTANQLHHKTLLSLKGSPEIVLGKCKTMIKNGKVISLTVKERKDILEHNKTLSLQGKRILAVGFYDNKLSLKKEDDLNRNDFTFLGLVALEDPLRDEVKSAVSQSYQAGIRIVIISGDQLNTVKAIAKQAGIITSVDSVIALTSSDLADKSDSELKKLFAKKEPVIVARALPTDKLRVVKLLQEQGEIVAVTGDGVNDAPALKQANVGVAMGKVGTDVAKDAANIVLLDDNFATIIKAIESGRTVFDNIKKFILYILTSNIPEIMPFLLMVLLGWPLALPVLLILAIDLGTDMLPAISLGQETPERDVMKQSPRSTKAKLLTPRMLARSYGLIGPLQTIMSFIMFFTVLKSGGWQFGDELLASDILYQSAVAAFFTTIIVIQIFNQLACRTVRMSTFQKPLTNPIFYLGVLVEILLIIGIVYWEPLEKIFGTAPFDPILYVWMIFGGIGVLLIEELRKLMYRKTGRFSAN